MPVPSSVARAALVTVAQREGGERSHRGCRTTRGSAQFTTAQGFAETDRRVTDGFGIIRFEAPTPTELFDWELGFLVPPGESAESLLQPASSAKP